MTRNNIGNTVYCKSINVSFGLLVLEMFNVMLGCVIFHSNDIYTFPVIVNIWFNQRSHKTKTWHSSRSFKDYFIAPLAYIGEISNFTPGTHNQRIYGECTFLPILYILFSHWNSNLCKALLSISLKIKPVSCSRHTIGLKEINLLYFKFVHTSYGFMMVATIHGIKTRF